MSKISFGVCCAPEKASIFADAGFDFFEPSVYSFLMKDEDYLKKVKASPIPCHCCNGFIGGDIKLTGVELDKNKTFEYVETALKRTAECGVKKIVFGSGGARRCPDGFPMEKAASQLLEFVREAAPLFEKYGVTMVVEPLCTAECNIINSVAAGAALVNAANHNSIKLLADSYHFYKSDNELDALTWSVPLLRHIHIATMPARLGPGMEEWDFTEFFSVLKHGGYEGDISVEGAWGDDPASIAPKAVEILHKTWDQI